MTIRVALPVLGRHGWTAGSVYLKNMLSLMRSHLVDDIKPSIFLNRGEDPILVEELKDLVDGRILVDEDECWPGYGRRLNKALLSGSDSRLARLLQAAGTDCTFEVANFYGWRFPIPTLAWLPDLQHRTLPWMFSRRNRWRRDIGFQMQIGSGRYIMVSSLSAKADVERFYPRARSRIGVVRFAVSPKSIPDEQDRARVQAQYNLPPRYFFLPNQFWKHKNHRIVLLALKRLHSSGKLHLVHPIILTGQPIDPLNPTHFDELMDEARQVGLTNHFRYLGLVSYDDVMALNMGSQALINPSLSEGWSTPIEEAKALGTPLILSDIPIHREQMPSARFFDPQDIDAVAEILLAATADERIWQAPSELRAARDRRRDIHAADLLATLRATVKNRKTPT